MAYSNIDGITIDQFNEIMEELGYDGTEIYYMNDMNGVILSSPYDAILASFYGNRFGSTWESFNPEDKYFTIDGYDNFISIPENSLQDYVNHNFKEDILDYVNKNEVELDGVEEDI